MLGGVKRCLGARMLLFGGRNLVPSFASHQLFPSQFHRPLVSSCAVVANVGGVVQRVRDGGIAFKMGGVSVATKRPFNSCSCLDASGGRNLRGVSCWNYTPTRISYSGKLRDLQKRLALFSTSARDVAAKSTAGVIHKELQNDKTQKESTDEQIADMQILRTLARNLWLKDNLEFQWRVAAALCLLVGAKSGFERSSAFPIQACCGLVISNNWFWCFSIIIQ